MIKPILTGVWVCAATMGSAYLGSAWQRPTVTTERRDHGSSSSDSTPVRTRMISVPVVAENVRLLHMERGDAHDSAVTEGVGDRGLLVEVL